MCVSDTSGGSVASARSASARCAGSCGASFRSGFGANGEGPDPEEPVGGEPLPQPRGRLLHAPILLQPARELLRRLLGLELGQLGGFVREQVPCLQLEQRRHEHEKLAARLEIELVALEQPFDERHDDPRDVHVREVQLLAQDQRQQQVEGACEGVQVQLELAHGVTSAGR